LDKFAKKVSEMREIQKEFQRLMYHPDNAVREELKKRLKKAEYDVDVLLYDWRNK